MNQLNAENTVYLASNDNRNMMIIFILKILNTIILVLLIDLRDDFF